MIMIELREAAIDKAFDKLEETKHHAKKTKLSLCELEDALYDCYESVREHDDEDYEDRDDFDVPVDEDEDRDLEINYRGRSSRSGKRRAMRMRYRDDEDTMRGSWRRSSNMRRAMRNRY